MTKIQDAMKEWFTTNQLNEEGISKLKEIEDSISKMRSTTQNNSILEKIEELYFLEVKQLACNPDMYTGEINYLHQVGHVWGTRSDGSFDPGSGYGAITCNGVRTPTLKFKTASRPEFVTCPECLRRSLKWEVQFYD